MSMPEPQVNRDSKGRLVYTDYDGEQLIVRRNADGGLWIDKRGEGPVYVRAADVEMIVAAMTGPPKRRTPTPGMNKLAGHTEWCVKTHNPRESACSRRVLT